MWQFAFTDKNSRRACLRIVESSVTLHTYYYDGDIIDVYSLSEKSFLHHMLQDDTFIVCNNPYYPFDEQKTA